MTSNDSSRPGAAVLMRRSLQTLLLCALLLPGAAIVSESREVVGRVVSVRGAVFAQSPGEERRTLECRDPIFEGDRVLSLGSSAAGIDAGTYYARLGENTVVEVGRQATGQPKLDVVEGHLRLIDSAGGNGDPAELSTPGLRVARPGPDQDAVVLKEKAGVVSMVCAYDEPVSVARRANPAERLTAAPGGCVVGKPREPLYAAEATHPQLAVLMRDACEDLAIVPVGNRFSPADVALGPTLLAGTSGSPAGPGGAAPPPSNPPFGPGPTLPCSGNCGGPIPPVPVPGPTSFPFIPPVLPVP